MSLRSKIGWLGALPAGALIVLGCGTGDERVNPLVPAPEPGEELLGGDTTVFDTTGEAFARPARNLSVEHRKEFALGDHIFNRNWVTAPASAEGNDGLGPTYNATSCSACHFKDGRGAPVEGDGEPLALLFRLSVPGAGEHKGTIDEPTYGGQLNPLAILGVPPEGRVEVTYEEVPGAYEDGTPFELRRPRYELVDLGYGPMDARATISPRIANHMVGLGLLEAVAEETLLGFADADDVDGDGISGRPNYVWSVEAGATVMGRFGWKANQPTVRQQSAGAFLGDIGMTTAVFMGESCPPPQVECAAAPHGGVPEIDDDKLFWIGRYASTLAVPARRDVADPAVLEGKQRFVEAGCDACHVPKMETGEHPELAELSHQIIRPFSDLLLHDMGEALADGRPDFEADGREWRTPPLWGIGLIPVVNDHFYLLHDGRARGLAEAILWHGGEAEPSREAFRAMPEGDRDQLLLFLESL